MHGLPSAKYIDNMMRSRKADIKIKRKVLNEYVTPVMTYGSETWARTAAQRDALAVAQRTVEWIMPGITLRDRKHNTWIRQQTGVIDVIDTINMSKRQWAGLLWLFLSQLKKKQEVAAAMQV